jgi:hypothetical protein
VPLFINDMVSIQYSCDIEAGNANDRRLKVGRLSWLESVACDFDSVCYVCCGRLTQSLNVAWTSSVDVKYT